MYKDVLELFLLWEYVLYCHYCIVVGHVDFLNFPDKVELLLITPSDTRKGIETKRYILLKGVILNPS